MELYHFAGEDVAHPRVEPDQVPRSKGSGQMHFGAKMMSQILIIPPMINTICQKLLGWVTLLVGQVGQLWPSRTPPNLLKYLLLQLLYHHHL